MKLTKATEPTAFIIFGGGGDLSWRKLVPALYNLHLDGQLPEKMAVIVVDAKEMDDEELRRHLRGGVDRFSRRGKTDAKIWSRFADRIAYLQGDFADSKTGTALGKRLSQLEKEWSEPADRVFYLATPPTLVETIVQMLSGAGLCQDADRDRLVVEKPFGRDLETARSLNRMLTDAFAEEQVYRIDHYLGKETVQNMLAFRFANALFEPIWDRRYIDHVQITVAESVGVGHRADYYDHAGALRDMVQNHLLQLLCLIAMESPVSFDADEIRSKKVEVLQAVRAITPEEVPRIAVRGQYGAGSIDGREVKGYRHEDGVNPASNTETFAALRLLIDNWRWQGVPFYLRTGKRLPTKVSEVSILFQPVPHQPFPSTAVENWQPNRLAIHIQPEEGIVLRIQAKQPGTRMILGPVDMRFRYQDTFQSTSPEAYETLLLDVMLGDATLFMRADQVEAAWSVITPILDVWDDVPAADFPDHPAGSWGPETAEALLVRDGRSWLSPVFSGATDDND